MIASRRKPSPSAPATNLPGSSGPRCTIVSIMRSMVRGSTGAPEVKLNCPHIPHMSERGQGIGIRGAEDRGRRSEGRGRGSEVGSQRAEVRGRKSEVRGGYQRSEVGGRRAEVRDQWSEAGEMRNESGLLIMLPNIAPTSAERLKSSLRTVPFM